MTVAIMAGGQSRRMGSDKAQLPVEGISLLERTARIAREVTDSVLVVGRSRPTDWTLDRVEFVPDEIPAAGPIGGLATALRHADGPVLALACDMPKLTATSLRWLRDAASAHASLHGLAVVNGEQIEPLFCVYTPACLPLVERQINAGRRSLQALIGMGEFARIAAPPEVAATLVNVNTPEEFQSLFP